ncbi:MAG: FAD-dependent oxidoreductase, partial [Isosphaeraceae bacterium]
MQDRHTIVIVGGGTAGISVAARLRLADPSLDVALVEPSEKHYYQPLWTLVGGGIFPREESERDESGLIPEGVTWIKDAVTTFQPGQNRIVTQGDRTISYDFLVVAPGIAIFWDKIKGLKDAVGKDGVCSNYDYATVESTWRSIQAFQGGNALFTQPSGAVKCGGAPQKIMYLADETFRKAGVRDKSRVI